MCDKHIWVLFLGGLSGDIMDFIQVLAFESPSLDFDVTMIIQVLIFLLLLLALKKYVLVPYLRAYDQRAALTSGAQEEARMLQEKAADAKKAYETERQKTYAEVESARKAQVSEANAEASVLVEAKRAEVQRDIVNRQAELQADLALARKSVEPQIKELSANIANKILV
jgi:F-type H+-transporting ATPase subunit b